MSWEIPRKDVRLLEQIGQGAFVQVWKGRMRRSPGSTDVMRVIIKKLQGKQSLRFIHLTTFMYLCVHKVCVYQLVPVLFVYTGIMYLHYMCAPVCTYIYMDVLMFT